MWSNFQGTFTVNATFDEQAADDNKGGVAFCDLDTDGDFDLVWTDAGVSQIWRNNNGSFSATGEPALSSGVPLTIEDIDGVACGDVDNDGDVDLFLAAASGPSHLFFNETLPGSDSPLVFARNNKGIDLQADGEAVAWADYDLDGDLDLAVNVNAGPNQLWTNSRNDQGEDKYLAIRALRCLPGGSYRDDIGATVRLFAADGVTMAGPLQEINGGRGHGSQDPATVHFGLPDGAGATYTIEVQFGGWAGLVGPVVTETVVPAELAGHQLLVVKDCAEANRAPVALAQEIWREEEGPVEIELQGFDPEGLPLTFGVVDPPLAGELKAGSADGRLWTYLPPTGGVDSDSFTFGASDGEHVSNATTVTPRRAPENHDSEGGSPGSDPGGLPPDEPPDKSMVLTPPSDKDRPTWRGGSR
jgi:hypothetical protein